MEVFSQMQHNGRQFDWLPAALYTRKTDMVEILANEIANLPERERLVFTLSYYEELEMSEVAFVLGETSLAITQLHASAVAHLKARLADAE